MKSTTFVLSALASVATVLAESIYFTAKSEDSSIDASIYSIHEGAGINYFLISSADGAGEVFQLENGVASNKQGQFDSRVGVLGPYLAAGPAISEETLSFDGDKLQSFNFWACKNTNDPYSYSTSNYIVAVNDKSNSTAPFDECTPIDISKSAAETSSVSLAVSSSAAPTVSSSAAPAVSSSVASAVSHSWANGTMVTSGVTVTDYTTYCPESTVITITTCSEDKCAPTTITVSEATTLTVTGECVFPTTTSAASSSVTTFEGGAEKAAIGVAGLAGVFALLI